MTRPQQYLQIANLDDNDGVGVGRDPCSEFLCQRRYDTESPDEDLQYLLSLLHGSLVADIINDMETEQH